MLSIIVPVYNVKDYLQKCLVSVANQTLSDIEIIVVDDGSTDGSGHLADTIASRYPDKMRVIHKKNGGLMSAWTLGVRASKGDYIGFVDSDDAVSPDMYEKLLKISVENDVEIVMCDSKDSLTGMHDRSSIERGLYEGERMNLIKSKIFPFPGNVVVSNARWNKLFKRHLIIENLKYTDSLSRTFEDRYIVPAAVMSAKSFYYLDEPLYIYTQDREGCNSKKYKQNLIDDVERMYEVQKQVLLDKGLYGVYGKNWEKLFLNCIRVYIGRNILGVDGFSRRLASAKSLFSSKYFRPRMSNYGHLMDGKLGIALRFSAYIHSPELFSLISYFTK